jgi:hypothetical protein
MEFTGPNLAGIARQSRPATERRHSMRHRVHSPAYASLTGSSQGTAQDLSEILDISEDGMSIQTSSPLEVNHTLNFCLDLSETRTRIRTSGQVVWSDASARAGIRFPKLSGSSLGQLKEWFFVNVLTAYDHARGWTAAADADASEGRANGPFLSADPPQNEIAFAVPGISDNGGGPAGPGTVHRQVEPNGYDREITLQSIAERALDLTRATGAAIALSEGAEMICLASAGSDAPPFGSRLEVGSGFSGECVRTGRSLRCDDSETDSRVDREGCRALGIRSMVAVPIRRGGKVAGLLEIFSSQPYAFNAKDIGVLQELAGTILSAAGRGVEAPTSLPETRKMSLPKKRPARTEKRPPPQVMTATTVAKPAGHRRLHKILLVSAVVTFAFAVLWLIAPWVSNQVRSSLSSRNTPHVRETQAPLVKPPSLPAGVTDLAGLRKLAERGDPAAQFALGARYATGEEVKQDYGEAVRWFTLAADRGHIKAQATLGAYYWAARGVPQDLSKAYFWSVLAQAGGDQASKYRVAVLTSRLTRSQVVAAQQEASDWLRNHQVSGDVPPSQ